MSNSVLHFIDSGGLYGAESVILNLSREMREDGAYEPIIGCIVSSQHGRNDLHDRALELGIRAEKLVIRNAYCLIDLYRIARRLKQLGIGLIHSHGYKPSVYGYLISLLTAIPVTATCHLWFLHGAIPLKMRVMVKLELLFYRFFPAIVAVSEPIRGILASHGIESDRIRVINNGIFLDDYLPFDRAQLDKEREILGIKPNVPCLINVARLTAQKAQHHIIDAAAQLRAEGKNLIFLIVGEGELMEELRARVREKGLEQTVRLLGFRSDVKRLLQVADIFVLPSLDEGMPMALLEAAASRTPIVATPVGDIPKLIRNDSSGVLVKTDDVEDLTRGIRSLVASEELRYKCAEDAWNSVRDIYSSKAMYQSYGVLYHGLLWRNSVNHLEEA